MPKKRTQKRPFLLDQLKSLIRVPIVNQASDFTCGVAAMLSVLYYWDKKEDDYETNLAKRLKANDKDGVVSTQIERYARSRDFQVLRKEDMDLEEIEDFIRDGKPVLVLLQAWPDSKRAGWKGKWENGHFAVAIGSDVDNIYFMDPSMLGNYTYIPKKEFIARWHDRDGNKKVHHLGVVIWRGRPSFDHRVVVKMG
jgi:predicted double-glycine peptidase